jgi:hypothetical protein
VASGGVGILTPMPLEHERSFSAESPVGRYWLRNCVGFHVEGLRGGSGVVEEVGLGPDGVDVLAVRRHNVLLPGTVLVPAHRVDSVQPWEDTIVLVSRRREARIRRAAQAKDVAHRAKRIARRGTQDATLRLKPVVRRAAIETGRAVRDGAIVIMRLLAALGTLLWGLAVLTRDRAPHARRQIANAASAVKPVARAYAYETRRVWRAQRQALASWQEARRERAEEPGDDGPLTRAGDDEDADARRRGTPRRSLDRAPAGEQADDQHDQRDDEQEPKQVRHPDAAADGEEKQEHDQYQEQW